MLIGANIGLRAARDEMNKHGVMLVRRIFLGAQARSSNPSFKAWTMSNRNLIKDLAGGILGGSLPLPMHALASSINTNRTMVGEFLMTIRNYRAPWILDCKRRTKACCIAGSRQKQPEFSCSDCSSQGARTLRENGLIPRFLIPFASFGSLFCGLFGVFWSQPPAIFLSSSHYRSSRYGLVSVP